MTSRPYKLQVAQSQIDDLHRRLQTVRLPDEPIGIDPWESGTSLTWIRRLTAYWRDSFDWRAQEARLNSWPQYTVDIGPNTIHYLHVHGYGPNPMPLLLLHGWPGSVFEFLDIIPLLSDPGSHGGDPSDAFTLVIPSLPGFGPSFVPGQPRCSIERMADCFTTLMCNELGYAHFGAQGGDWGASVAARLGHAYPEQVTGIHLNLLPLPRSTDAIETPTQQDKDYISTLERWLYAETGYSLIQGTRPQTLAYALADSPTGLAAWITEKFRAWSDCGGDIERSFTLDTLLADVSLYWFTNCAGASFWPYFARHNHGWPFPLEAGVGVPTGYAEFPAEIIRPPRSLAEKTFTRITRWTSMPRGGHFAALEQPQALAREVQAFFRPLRQ